MLQNLGLLFFRVALSMLMLVHGWPKLMNFSAKAANFPDPLGVGSSLSLGMTVFAEFFCSLLIILGLGTRWASIPLTITMLVAWYLHGVKWGDPWMQQEKAVLFLVSYVTIAIVGGGKWGLDSKICPFLCKNK